MAKAAVYNQMGEKMKDLDLNPAIFGIEKIDGNLVHAAVRTQRNNIRGPWAHAKNKGEVAGSGKKPWKQKGTGRARAGSVRSPLWRHGGVTFGPRSNRDWSLKMNKSASRKALFTVLTDKLNGNKLIIVDKFDSTAKTKDLANKLKIIASNAGFGNKYSIVLAAHNKDLEKAGRNLASSKVMFANQLNVMDLMRYDTIITQDALKVIEQTYLK